MNLRRTLLLACLLALVSAVRAEWRDIKVTLADAGKWQTLMASSKTIYITVDGEGNIGTTENSAEAAATLTGEWHGTSYGWSNFTASVPVDRSVKVTYATHDYGDDITITKEGGTEVATLNTVGNKWSNDHSNVKTVYCIIDAATTLYFSTARYNPYFAVEAMTAEEIAAHSANHTLTYYDTDGSTILGSQEVTNGAAIGTFAYNESNVSIASGKVFRGWFATDTGGKKYKTTDVVSSDLSLYAIATNEEIAAAGKTFNYALTNQYFYMEDHELIASVGNGAWHDNQHGWIFQNGDKLQLTVAGNATITVGLCQYSSEANISVTTSDDSPVTTFAAKVNTDGNTQEFSYTGEATTLTLTFAGTTYIHNVTVVNEAAGDPWANYSDFALDLRRTNGFINSSTLTTVGFMKSGDNIVSTTSDDTEAIGTLTGKSNNDDHGLRNFSMRVAVPGYAKITIGTCFYGTGNGTISGTNGFSKAVSNKAANCYHQNTAQNVAITYYDRNEGTTLTLTGWDYVPYIAIEEVAEIPAEHTVNFYNGESLVSTRTVYNGVNLGTLPNAPEVADGKHFRGWYTATNATGVKATASTVVTTDINYYAYVMDVTTENGYVIVDNSGTNAENGQSFLNAVEYCTEKAGGETQKIYLPNGTYDLGSTCRTEVGSNIVMLGESRDGVVICNTPTAAGIQATSVLRITGDNVYLQNLTLRNDFDYANAGSYGVAVALEIEGDNSICNNVQLLSNQDTYYSHSNNTALKGYFKGGRIEGTVDYVCGNGNMWFEGTEFYNRARSSSDVIFAPATLAGTTYGYVCNNCVVDGAANQNGNYNIARPWSESPALTLLNTTFKQLPTSAGYTSMTNGLVVRFHESNSKDGDGNAVTGHSITACNGAAGSHDLYSYDVSGYTYANVLGGWDPEATIKLYSASLTSNVGKWASYTPTFNCVLADANAKAYIVTAIDKSSYTVTATPVSVMKAGEGYFVHTASGNETVAVNATYQTPDDITGNMLVGCPNDTPLTTEGNTKYFLGVKEGTAGLYYVDTNITIPAGKCYLQSTDTEKAPLGIDIQDGQTTGISAIEHSTLNIEHSEVYNLNGQRVSKPTKGLYIVNGRKVIVK